MTPHNRCEGGDNLFKPRIAAQRVPKWMQAQLSVVHVARNFRRALQLLDREIDLSRPRISYGQVFDRKRTVDRILVEGDQFDCAPAFANGLPFPPKGSVDHAEDRKGLAVIGLIAQRLLDLSARRGKSHL